MIRDNEIIINPESVIFFVNGKEHKLTNKLRIYNQRIMISLSDVMKILELKNDLSAYDGYAMHQDFTVKMISSLIL